MTAIATLPVVLGTGIHSARPAAADVGKGGLYSCTTHSLVYQTDGSSWTTWATLGSGTGASVTSAILTSGDITLTQNTYTDILSLSLAAGTYVIWGQANLTSTSGAQDVSAAIYNSTDAAYLTNGSMSMAATGYDETIMLVCTVVLGGTKTIKLQGTGSSAGGSKAFRATQTNSTGNMATQIVALKIA